MSAATGHVKIVDHFLDQKAIELPDLRRDDLFEVFAAELATREFQLEWDEIEDGIVDGSDDGQIDGLFITVDGSYVRDTSNLRSYDSRRAPHIAVTILQTKNTDRFQENPFSKLRTSLHDLFDPLKKMELLRRSYNAGVIEKIEIFRAIHRALAPKKCSVSFRVIYACKGDASRCSGKMQTDADSIEAEFKANYFQPSVSVQFLGATELISLARLPSTISKELKFAKPPTSDGSSGGWVGLVKLTDFYALITDEDGALLSGMLDSNVRDFESNSDVNDEILASLNASDSIDFWRLNNGVTIICDDVTPSTMELFHIETPLIVNGLQTSTMIWRYFGEVAVSVADGRHLLVRLIKASDENVRSQIIRCTNRQTPIAPSQLRATDSIHGEIELYFRAKSRFYERRKNQYI